MTYQPKHKHYDRAYWAHSGTSFVPEKRADTECKWYDEMIQKLKDAGSDWAVEKFDRLFLKSMAAKARCYSSMIAGPARFPVARMQKYGQWERNASDEMINFLNKALKPPAPPRTELDYKIEAKEYQVGEITVLQNTEENRLQLLFPGKPDESVRTKLKSRGFKWSPRNQAWQRQLTPNALYMLPGMLKEIT